MGVQLEIRIQCWDIRILVCLAKSQIHEKCDSGRSQAFKITLDGWKGLKSWTTEVKLLDEVVHLAVQRSAAKRNPSWMRIALFQPIEV